MRMVASPARRQDEARVAWGPLLLLVCAAVLHGCSQESGGTSEEDEEAARLRALQTCPTASFGKNGFVGLSHAGQEVTVVCPEDLMYSGPPLECNWVDRVCVASRLEDVDPAFCLDQFNFTLRGKGLSAWPHAVDPQLVSPTTGDRTPRRGGREGATEKSGTGAVDTEGHSVSGRHSLPKIMSAEDFQCTEEPYIALDFWKAELSHNNLFGQGPDSGAKSMVYEGIGALEDGTKIDLEVSTPVGSAPAVSADPERNGKGGSSGRISINSTDPITLRFRFKKYRSSVPVLVPKVMFTLLSISQGNGKDVEVIANGLSEYFLSQKSFVEVHRMSSASYAFGGVLQSRVGMEPEMAVALDPEKAAVTDLYRDILNRSAVLVYRNTSEFMLSVRMMEGSQDFLFAGRSAVADRHVGLKVICQHPQRPLHEDRFLKTEAPITRSGSSLPGIAAGLAVAACVLLVVAASAGAAFQLMYTGKSHQPTNAPPGPSSAPYKVFSQNEI